MLSAFVFVALLFNREANYFSVPWRPGRKLKTEFSSLEAVISRELSHKPFHLFTLNGSDGTVELLGSSSTS